MAANHPIPTATGSISLGQYGANWIDDTGAYTGDWCVITALTNTVFASPTRATSFFINGGAQNVAANLAGKSLAQGLSLFGRFSNIQLTSGSVIAYRATPLV